MVPTHRHHIILFPRAQTNTEVHRLINRRDKARTDICVLRTKHRAARSAMCIGEYT